MELLYRPQTTVSCVIVGQVRLKGPWEKLVLTKVDLSLGVAMVGPATSLCGAMVAVKVPPDLRTDKVVIIGDP